MTKLNELTNSNIRITNNEELEEWKINWDGISRPPKSVIEYMTTIVLPLSDAKSQQSYEKFIRNLK